MAVARSSADAAQYGESVRRAIAAWRRPIAQLESGRRMSACASAAIDGSDGLVQDVRHLAHASGVRVVLELGWLLERDSELSVAAEQVGSDARTAILFGGEDYVLIATSPTPIPGFFCIGEVAEGEGVTVHENGVEVPVQGRGFDHFAL